ncbi:MAG: FxLYD domain-containing protein [Oscillospiraceae bacterium]|nr:FxLYD domain-containing protein [Oscillospiraceae bacterium]
MDRMKQFRKYFIIIGAVFVFLMIATHFVMHRPRTNLNYRITFESPQLVMTRVEATDVGVYVEGEISNRTGELIDKAYLQFIIYNERENYVGSGYIELRNFEPNETVMIEERFGVRNSYSVRINFLDERPGRGGLITLPTFDF